MSQEPTQQADLLTTFEPTTPKNFARPRELLDAEFWLAQRLEQHGVRNVFDGLTDSAQRCERFRQAILDHGLSCAMACKQDNERVASTYAEAFESMYHEPLEPVAKPSRRKSHPAAPSAAARDPAVPSREGAGATTAASLDDDDIPF